MPRKAKRKQPPIPLKSTRPKKKRRTNSNHNGSTNTRNTKQSTVTRSRSERLKARNAKKEQKEESKSQQASQPPLRRSSRIRHKIQQKAIIEEQKEPELDNQDDIEMMDISEGIQEIQVKSFQNKTKYEPLPPPQRYFPPAPNDYISLQSRLEIGNISPSYFREMILENELNEFWNGVKENQYRLQSVLPIFANTQSTDKKINAFKLHDTELFAFSGSKDGFLGITNYTQFPYQTIAIRCHSDRITDIRSAKRRPLHLFTSSFDGTVKIMDLTRIPSFQIGAIEQQEIDHFNDSNNYFGDTVINNGGGMIHGFDIKNNGREVYAVDNDGFLLVADLRTNENFQYPIAEKKIATLRINPSNDTYFAITENRRKTLQLWDMRMLNTNNLQCIHQRKFSRTQKNINFSDDGQRLLTCGRDDTIRIYDQPLVTFDRFDHKFTHKNDTGIWICDFKPIFHPKYSQIVLTGCLDHKGIDVICIRENGQKRTHNIHDLTKVKSIHTFGAVHPRFDDYLFGVTYDKLVFYAKISDDVL